MKKENIAIPYIICDEMGHIVSRTIYSSQKDAEKAKLSMNDKNLHVVFLPLRTTEQLVQKKMYHENPPIKPFVNYNSPKIQQYFASMKKEEF